MVARGFRMDFPRPLALNLERSGKDLPPIIAPVHFKPVLDLFPILSRLGPNERDEDPLLVFQLVKSLHFAVRDSNHFGMIIRGADPWLFAHYFASVVKKCPKLLGINYRSH